jgi:glycosyltransferase involved in cell wall biosynthesis
MQLALIADAFPPLRTSASIQIRDLSLEFANQGHDLTVFVPDADLKKSHEITIWNDIFVVRIKAFKTKDVGYLKRTFAEFMLPYSMLFNLRNSSIKFDKFDGVVWYSPTIFFGPLARFIKSKSKCKAYLIIRDIFPEWALDLGLMRKSIPYFIFKAVAYYQYAVADVIGIQSKGNESYFLGWKEKPKRKLEVLQNWISDAPNVGCSINISATKLYGRKIFVYAGNMGVAQDVDVLISLAETLKGQKKIGFVFVGRGRNVSKIKHDALMHGLDNLIFYDEIDPSEIAGLYEQCHVGLVLLDLKHKTHNIPGKFLSYMQAGLPVLARVNHGNDLVELIDKYQVGRSFTESSIADLSKLAEILIAEVDSDLLIGDRCKALSAEMFSSEVAVKKIVYALA